MQKEKVLLRLKEKARKTILNIQNLKKDIVFCVSLLSIARLQPFSFLESCGSKVRKLIYLKIQRSFLEDLKLYRSQLELKIDKISLKIKTQEKVENTRVFSRKNLKSNEIIREEREQFQRRSSLFSGVFKNIKKFDSMKETLELALRRIEEKLNKNQGGLENARLKSLEDKISRGLSFS